MAHVTHPRGELWFEDELIVIAAPETDPEGAPFVSFASNPVPLALAP